MTTPKGRLAADMQILTHRLFHTLEKITDDEAKALSNDVEAIIIKLRKIGETR